MDLEISDLLVTGILFMCGTVFSVSLIVSSSVPVSDLSTFFTMTGDNSFVRLVTSIL